MNDPIRRVQPAAEEISGSTRGVRSSGARESDTRVGMGTGDTPDLSPTADYVPRDSADVRAGQSSAAPNLPGYEILDELGRGGMGVVYRARQIGLDRIVAIKMLLAAEHASPELLTRFRTEAQVVATLQHPNIVQIHEIGHHNGLPYFSLEYVPGGSLARKIDRTPQPADDSARIVEVLARAVEVAHRNEIVHRDLKPANVLLAFADHSSGSAIKLDPERQRLLDEGPLRNAIPKISDFGLAKRLELDSQQTRSGQILGSPSYMAPEQARGDVHQVGPPADVYALGAILYELLTGRPPFLAASLVDTVQQVVTSEPIPPSRLAAKVPRDLETICLKCLQKDPRKRYASAEALADDLRRFQSGEPIQARPVGNGERFLRWCRRSPRVAIPSIAAVLLLISIAAVSTWTAVTVNKKNKQIEDEKQTAQANAEVASGQATLALRIIQSLIQNVQQRLSDAPSTQAIRKDILDLANQGVKQVADKVDSSTSKDATQLAIHQYLGALFVQLGEMKKAVEQFQRAEAIARERTSVKNHSDSSRNNLANVLRALGQVTQEVDRDMNVARKYYEESLQVRQSILDKPFPGDGNAAIPNVIRFDLAEDHVRVGVTIYKLGDPAEALRHWARGLELRLALRESLPKDSAVPEEVKDRMLRALPLDIARTKLGIGELSFRLRDPDKALAIYSEVTETYEKTLEKSNGTTWLKYELGRILGNFGDIKLHVEGPDGALPHYERSLTLLKELTEYDAYEAGYQRDLALDYYRLGNAALRSNDVERAAEHFRASLALREKLVELDKSNDRRRMELMLALAHCGEHIRAETIANEFRQRPSPDNELLVDVGRCLSQCSQAAADDADLRQGYTEDAIASLDLAVANGYRDAVFLESDPDLDPLRKEPAFAAVLKQLELLSN